MANDCVVWTSTEFGNVGIAFPTAALVAAEGSLADALAFMVVQATADPDATNVTAADSATFPATGNFGPRILDQSTPITTLVVNMTRAKAAIRERAAAAPDGYRAKWLEDNDAAITAATTPAELEALWTSDLETETATWDLFKTPNQFSHIYNGSGPPGVNDDSTQGVVVGTTYWDATNDAQYRCTDNTAGAAVWKIIASRGLSAIANVVPSAGKFPVWTGSTSASAETITSAGLALLDDASATAQVSTLGLKAGTETLDLDGLTVGGGTLTHTLNGTSITSTIEAHSEGGSDLGALTIHRHDGPAAFGAHIVALRSNGTHASPTVAANGDHLLRVIAAGFDGTDYAMGGEVRFIVSGTPGSDDMPTDIVFLTSADGSHAPAEAMRVTSAGNVTFANPSTVLDTAGAVRQGLHTIPVNAAAMWPRTTAGCAALATLETSTNKGNFPYLAFDSSTVEYAQFLVSFPKSWNASTVTARFRWAHPSTTVNFGVAWRISGASISNGDALDVAQGGSSVLVTDTGGNTEYLYVTDVSSAITIVGTPAKGDSVLFEVRRASTDGADTMTVDAYLIGVDLFYTINASTDA